MKIQLNQSQALSLNMTQNLQQSIELLRYSNDELFEFLRQEALENPLFELKSSHQVASFDFEEFIHEKEDSCERTYLIEQIRWLDINEEEKEKLKYLVLSLDESGYMPLSNEEMSDLLEVDLLQVEYLLEQLQQLEPAGVGARDLKERLMIQLELLFPNNHLSKEIVEHSLLELADKNYTYLMKKHAASELILKEAISIIQSLNPHPINLRTESIQVLTPDIVVDRDERGNFIYSLNDYYVPEIYFNESYALQMRESTEMKAYVRRQYDRFKWIRMSLLQRKETISKIMDSLLSKQRGFFSEGLKGLKPLTLVQVAREINMHESTVSRATTNKVLQTPLGTFYLKDLFQTGLSTRSGQTVSNINVKMKLKELIKREDKARPLSDQRLVDSLIEQGIQISRRTVAKYRNELKIPASSKRKLIQL